MTVERTRVLTADHGRKDRAVRVMRLDRHEGGKRLLAVPSEMRRLDPAAGGTNPPPRRTGLRPPQHLRDLSLELPRLRVHLSDEFVVFGSTYCRGHFVFVSEGGATKWIVEIFFA